MNKITLPYVLGILTPIVAGWIFINAGGMPVATKGKPLPFERYIAGTALHAAMRGQTSEPAPILADDTNLKAGADVYKSNCAVCHGYAGGIKTSIAKGLFPPPPQLLPPKKGVTDDPVGETYWKAKNGIRLTGMPGFESTLTDTQLWQVSLFLLNTNKLPAGVLESVKP